MRLLERNWSALKEASVDGEGVVKNVLLLRAGPGNLADRHWYSDACIKQAAASGIFEAVQAYFDHPTAAAERDGDGRSVKDLAGYYDNISYKPYHDARIGATTGLFADFHPRADCPEVQSLIKTALEFQKKFPRKSFFGLSINASGSGEPDTINGEEWDRVDQITEADSVDLVNKAGAGGAPFIKESFRVKTRKTTKTRERRGSSDGITLTIDADKVRESLKGASTKMREAVKAEILKVQEAAGVKISAEQDAAIDKALGLVDGGAIDKIIDRELGVAESEEGTKPKPKGKDDADEPDEDETESDKDEEDDKDADDDEDDAEEDMDEGDPDAMSPAQLKAALKKERKARKEAKKEAKEARESARSAGAQSSKMLREQLAERAMDEVQIPKDFRARLKDELIERKFTKMAEMLRHAKAFDLAFIRPHLGGGSPLHESDRGPATVDFKFEEAL